MPLPPQQPIPPDEPTRLRPGRNNTGPRHGDRVAEVIAAQLPGRPEITARGDGVLVAIFDTWPVATPKEPAGPGQPPKLSRIMQFAASAANAAANIWLQDAAAGQLVPPSLIHDDYLAPGDAYGLRCMRYTCQGYPEQEDDISSHGLFVADIVNDMAPNATISIYRVLDDYGMGDMLTIAAALEDAMREAANLGKRLVANFSLGIAPPLWVINAVLSSPDCYFSSFGPFRDAQQTAVQTLVAKRDPSHIPESDFAYLQAERLVSPTNANLINVLAVPDFLFNLADISGVLVVGAAGNDSCPDRPELPPRIPAALNGALAVSARLGRSTDWKPADYSNSDDFFVDNDGVGAFGGEADQSATQSNVVDTSATGGVMGLYIGRMLPSPLEAGDTATANDGGWAMWAGTSFAAPVASGYAASLWSEEPTVSSSSIRNQVALGPGSNDWEYLPFTRE